MDRDQLNPFAAPLKVDAPTPEPELSFRPDVGREGRLVVLRGGSKLPARCFRCNATKSVEVRPCTVRMLPPWDRVFSCVLLLAFTWTLAGITLLLLMTFARETMQGMLPSWAAWLLPSGRATIAILIPAPWLLAVLPLGWLCKKDRVDIGYCKTCTRLRKSRSRSQNVGLSLWLLNVILLVSATQLGMPASGLQTTLTLVSVPLGLVGGWKMLRHSWWMHEQQVFVQKADESAVWLTGAGPDFLDSLPSVEPVRVTFRWSPHARRPLGGDTISSPS
jgi:hypothetical protein